MKRDVKLYLSDIVDSIERIEGYMKGVTKEAFSKNKLKQDAVMRRLGIIGEATKNVPEHIRKRHLT